MGPNQFATDDESLFDIATHAPGPSGSLPLTPEMLRDRPSGDLFGWTQNAGMGWEPAALGGREFLILSTHGGIRAPDGTPIALGYHTGHWEVGLLMEAAAREFKARGRDSRSPPSAPIRATAARRARRRCSTACLSQRRGDDLPPADSLAADAPRRARRRHLRQGPAGDDDGAGRQRTICPACSCRAASRCCRSRARTPARVQTIGVRFAHGEISLEEAADLGCRACASPGGGCQFLGTAATSQVVGEALGMSLGHSALAPSGHPIWLDMARRSARALMRARSARHAACATSSPTPRCTTRW